MTMSNWIYTLKTILKCKRFTSNRMREIILEECLVCKQPVFGAYVVDGQKVWENVVVHDFEVMKRLRCMNIYPLRIIPLENLKKSLYSSGNVKFKLASRSIIASSLAGALNSYFLTFSSF